MTPRLEYALSAGALAIVLVLMAGRLFDFDPGNAFLWWLAATAGASAAIAAAWVCRWRWVSRARSGLARLAGTVSCTVLVAMALFFPLCVGLSAFLSPEEPVVAWFYGAAVFGAFAVVFGTLPALLATTPLAWRFLRRRNLRPAA